MGEQEQPWTKHDGAKGGEPNAETENGNEKQNSLQPEQ